MTDDTILPFWFPAVRGKKLTAGFDGGRLSSDGGVMLLAQAARRMRIAEKLAAVIPDPRDPTRVVHPLRICSRASSPSPAATKTPTISTACAPTPPSSSPAGGCRRAVRT